VKRTLIDISRVLEPGVGEPGGHPMTKIEEFQTHAVHKRSNAFLSYSIHCGTHLDTPYHFYEKGKKVEEMAIDKFVGDGVLVDLDKKVQENTAISLEQILANSKLGQMNSAELLDTVVLINTGWGENFGKEKYYKSNPYLSNVAAKWFADKKIKAVGLDFPPDKKQGEDVHKILLGAEVIIIENLTNMTSLKNKDFRLYYFPIKLKGQGGGPTRVIAEVLDDDEN
jgi:arylformamidase